MTVSCPDCRSVFRVDPSKVPATGVRARCSVCGGIIVVSGGTGPMRTPVRTPVPAVSSFPTTPSLAAPPVSAPPRLGATTPPRAVSSPPGAITPRMATPAAAPGRIARMTPPMAPAAAPMSAAPVPFAPPSVPAQPADAHSAPVGTVTAPTVSAPGGAARRAINPFLNADPGQRARRLARALVSDLVAYHPRKRDEGLAQGTLRQLFREEIKKSYEEYVEQVGKELAESTPHFQDALNDILASGQRLF